MPTWIIELLSDPISNCIHVFDGLKIESYPLHRIVQGRTIPTFIEFCPRVSEEMSEEMLTTRRTTEAK